MADIDLTTTATVPAGTSITVTVYEDTNQDGAAENQVTQAVADGTNTYTLSGFETGSGNDYWLDVELSTTNTETTASLESATASVPTAPATTPVSGTVTLDGSPIEGAKITGINDTQGTVQGVTTTDVNGNYSIEFPTGDLAHILMEYDDGTTQYNDESKPFVVAEAA